MKSFSFFFASVVLFLLTCSYDHQIAPDNEDMGGVKISVKLGPIGSLGKKMSIEFDALTLTLTAPGEDSVIAVIAISDTSQQTVTKTFSNLASLKTWTVSAVAKDKAGKTTHSGTTTFEIQPHGTTAVTLNLAAQYSMLKARFFPIRDSVNEVRLWVDGAIIADSSFGRIALCGDTVKLSDDYLSASPSGIQHAIRMDARGIIWGDDTLLYRGDTNITVVSGINASYAIKLKWVGPKVPPPGSATMTVVLGATGMVTMNGEMEDELNNEIKEIFAVNQEASLKIREWLQSGSIDVARDKLVQFLNTKKNVKKIVVADDGSVVSVEYMNGLEAVALFGKPGTLSYPDNNSGITVSVSADTINNDPLGWVRRDNERKYVYNKMSSGTAISMDSTKHDASFTLKDLISLGKNGFIHIATHGGIHPVRHEMFFLSGDSAKDTSHVDEQDWCQREDPLYPLCTWYKSGQIFPEIISGLWAVSPSFISSNAQKYSHSLVILSFCNSMFNSSIYDLLISKGAQSVVGWTGTPDTAFAREAIQIFLDQMVDGGITVSQACNNTNSTIAGKYPSNKDLLISAGDPDMQLTFKMTTTSNPTSGGTVSRARVAAAYGKGEKVTLTAIPTTSYRFSEWTRGIIGSINPKDVTITNDTLITANFIRQYIVTFNSQGGSAVLPQTIDSGSFTTTPTSPTRTGYTFTGWFKESACVNEWIFASNQVAINMVLYAKWTINSYIVTYIGNGNTGGIAPSMTTHAYNTIITVLANTGNLVKTNFAFTGWNTASNGSGTGYAIGATFFIAAANVTLFAQWTGKPEFVYPQNNQQLDYIGWYLFKVKPVANATGYLWGFWQNQILIWENYRDEGVFSSEEYGIQPGTIAHGKFSPGAVDVWVRAYVNKAWTDAAIITINLVE